MRLKKLLFLNFGAKVLLVCAIFLHRSKKNNFFERILIGVPKINDNSFHHQNYSLLKTINQNLFTRQMMRFKQKCAICDGYKNSHKSRITFVLLKGTHQRWMSKTNRIANLGVKCVCGKGSVFCYIYLYVYYYLSNLGNVRYEQYASNSCTCSWSPSYKTQVETKRSFNVFCKYCKPTK